MKKFGIALFTLFFSLSAGMMAHAEESESWEDWVNRDKETSVVWLQGFYSSPSEAYVGILKKSEPKNQEAFALLYNDFEQSFGSPKGFISFGFTFKY